MKTIKTTVDDATYGKLVAIRKEEGLPSVSALFLRKCNALSPQTEAVEITKKAVQLALKQPKTVRYRIKDLFPALAWEGYSKSARIGAGRLFNSKVNAPNSGLAEVGISGSNHMFYKTL